MRQFDLPGAGMQLFHEVRQDNLGTEASALAYHFLLALFPFFIFLATVGGLLASAAGVDNPANGVLDQLAGNLPHGVAGLMTSQLRAVIAARQPGLLSFGLIASIWATMGGIKSVMRAMNVAYDVPESRSFVWQNLVALGLTLVFSVFVLAAFGLFMVGGLFAQQIAQVLALPAAVITAARWLIAVVLLLLASGFLYWAAPNVRLTFKWVTPGSALFTLGWLLGTVAFAAYVSHFGSYNATYGTLGGVVVLLLWFFLTGYLLLLGAEINALADRLADTGDLARQRQEKQRRAWSDRPDHAPEQPRRPQTPRAA